SLNPLFVTPVCFLFLGCIINAVIRKWWPERAFSASELATVYIMLAIACTFATHDYIINLMSIMPWAGWYASPENKWESIMWPHLPQWLLVWDEGALKGYYEGGSSIYRVANFLPWILPTTIWIGFVLVSVWIMFCLNVLVRKAWIQETKLSFPVVRLPLALLGQDGAKFYQNKLLWIGFAIPIITSTLSGLNELYPSVPYFETRAKWLHFYTPPWTRLNGMCISLYPFAIGLAYFVPTDIAFSCWFFYLFVRFQHVFGHFAGLAQLRGFPFVMEQGIGAWTTYAGLLLYLTRAHWKRLILGIIRGQEFDDSGEMFSYRLALGGAVGGIIVLLIFWHFVGMSLIPSVVTVLAYFLLAIAITRVRGEAASQHTVWDLEPRYMFGLVDSKVFTRGDFVGGALSHWFWRLNRSHSMPTQLESLKIGDVLNIKPRSMTGMMFAATVVAVIAAPWAFLHIVYREGATAKCIGYANWTGVEAFSWLQSMLTVGKEFELTRLLGVLFGSALTLGLWLLQSRYTWLFLHPLGYCAGPGLIWLWFPFFLAWAAKSAILRYGGQPAYRKLTPFFLGLILGDYSSGGIWAIIGPMLKIQGYQAFH
ncbi:MAG TPA: DUF6785 family protein, partial [Armatimonadota bacterium]|nr:DUF6785 family protein [Armatimonadota bacterium]